MWTLLRTNRSFRKLFASSAVTSFGETAVYLSLAIWVKDLTGSNAAAGIVFLTITLPGLFAPVLGHIVDRVSRRRLMIGMDLAMAALFLTLLAVRSEDQVWIIYLVTLAYGVLSASPAPPALLKDALPSDDAASARSLLMAVGEGVRIVSPVAGAAVYVAFGGAALAVFGSATFLIAALLLISVRVVESEPEPVGERLRTSVVAGFRFIRGVPLLLRLSLTTVAFMLVVGLLETAVFAAIHGLDRPAAFFGVITSFQGGGSVVGGLISGTFVKRWGEVRTTCAGYAMITGGLLLCLAGNTPLFLLGVFCVGLGVPFVMISLGTALHLYTPGRMQGRVNAAVTAVSGGAQALSIAAGAALIGVLGYQAMYLLTAGTALLCAASLLLGRVPQPEIVKSVADDAVADDAVADDAVADDAVADDALDPETSR